MLVEGSESKTGHASKTVPNVFSGINYDASIPNMTNIHIKQEYKTMRVFTVPEQLKTDICAFTYAVQYRHSGLYVYGYKFWRNVRFEMREYYLKTDVLTMLIL